MKKLLLIALITLLNTACSFSPSTYLGASTVKLELDETRTINTDDFKTDFFAMMTKNERLYFTKKILNTLKYNERYGDLQKQSGSNAMVVGALGGNPFDGGVGGAASLILDVAAKISEANSGGDFSIGMRLTDEWIGKQNIGVDEVKAIVQKRALVEVTKMANAFGYDIVCKYLCESNIQTYELTKRTPHNNPEVYDPDKLVIFTSFHSVSIPHEESLYSLVAGDRVKYHAKISVDIMQPSQKDNEGNLVYFIHTNKDNKKMKMYFNPGAVPIFNTTLGRNMYRMLSKGLPGFYYGSKLSNKHYGLYNGEVYLLQNLSNHEKFKGTLILN